MSVITTNILHPWHGVTVGENAPEKVTAVIEISKGSRLKYEVDKASGLLKMDRVLYSSYHYPTNYGFLPQTLGEDNDPLDILVFACDGLQPLCILDAKVIGVMHMIDEGEGDDKIIAVAANDRTVSHFNDIEDLPDHYLTELRNFFESYKTLEEKKVIVNGFSNKETAHNIINASIDSYQEKYGKKTVLSV